MMSLCLQDLTYFLHRDSQKKGQTRISYLNYLDFKTPWSHRNSIKHGSRRGRRGTLRRARASDKNNRPGARARVRDPIHAIQMQPWSMCAGIYVFVRSSCVKTPTYTYIYNRRLTLRVDTILRWLRRLARSIQPMNKSVGKGRAHLHVLTNYNSWACVCSGGKQNAQLENCFIEGLKVFVVYCLYTIYCTDFLSIRFKIQWWHEK